MEIQEHESINSASRLYPMIVEFYNSGNNSASQIFMKIFELQNDPAEDELYDCLINILNLASKVKEDIQKLSIKNQNKFLPAIKAVIKGIGSISVYASNGFGNFRNHVDKDILTRLEFCIEALNDESETTLDKQKLDNLLDDLNEMLKEVQTLRMDSTVKSLFVKNIQELIIGVLNYNLWGSEGLRTKLEAAFGSIILNGNIIKNEEEKSFARKLMNLVGYTNQMVSTVNGVKESISGVIKLFLGSGGDNN